MVFGVGFKAKNIPSFSVNTSSLVLWLRADAGVLWIPSPGFGGGGVYQWTDQSGRGNNFTQTTTANQPVYFSGGIGSPNGQPYLIFTAAGLSELQSATPVTTATSNWTQFIVVNVTANASNAQFLFLTGTAGSGGGFGFQTDTGGTRDVSKNSVSFGSFGNLTTKWEVWANWDTSGTNTTCQVNGVPITSSTNISPTAATGHSTIGSTSSPEAGNFSISEVIIFARTLAAGELLSVNSYLMSKYGI